MKLRKIEVSYRDGIQYNEECYNSDTIHRHIRYYDNRLCVYYGATFGFTWSQTDAFLLFWTSKPITEEQFHYDGDFLC